MKKNLIEEVKNNPQKRKSSILYYDDEKRKNNYDLRHKLKVISMIDKDIPVKQIARIVPLPYGIITDIKCK